MGYLDDVTRRRIAAVVLLVAIAAGVLAKIDAGPFSDPPTQSERAQTAVEDFFAAAHDKDFRGMCKQLTPQARVQLLQVTAGVLPESAQIDSCPEAIEAEEKILEARVGQTLTDTRLAGIRDSRVSANRAAVDAELVLPGAKRPELRTFQLELLEGEWKISGSIFL